MPSKKNQRKVAGGPQNSEFLFLLKSLVLALYGQRPKTFHVKTGNSQGLARLAALVLRHVLDESFASLDPENLRQCLDCGLKRAKTLLVVAHP